MSVIGEIETYVKLGDLSLEVNAIVSRDTDDVLLGLDWFCQHSVHSRFESGTVEIQGKEFPVHNRRVTRNCRRIVALDNIQIPPKCEMNIWASYRLSPYEEDISTDDWVTDPGETDEGLLVASTILPQRKGRLPIRVLIVSDK